ncbi:MAG TPA: hypothetical protein PK303_03545 [bacterium]|nr:hypothetical protein [bacterium]
MSIFISFYSGYSLFQKHRMYGLPIEKCKIENFRQMQSQGCWIKNFINPVPELHYFNFFQYQEGKFPNLSVIVALSRGIELSDQFTYFLADFMTVDGTTVIGRADISEHETEILAKDIQETFDYFEFDVVAPGQILAKFAGNYPYINWKFPFQIVGYDYRTFLPQNGMLRTAVRIIENSYRLLEKHPVNRVRIDLGENPANFLWLHSQNKHGEKIIPLPEKTKKRAVFFSQNGLMLNSIARFLGFEILDQLNSDFDDHTIAWLNFKPQTFDTIGLIHTWEFIDRELLSFLRKDDTKIVIEFNTGFYHHKDFSFNFLWPVKSVNPIKKTLMTKKFASNFLLYNG